MFYYTILAECSNCSTWQEYVSLLRDKPHWLFEYTLETVTFIVGWLVGHFWLRRHDKKHLLNKAAVEKIIREYLEREAILKENTKT